MTEENEKTTASPQKSFLAIGPTLHYSHDNVMVFRIAALFSYVVTLLFWSKILTGELFPFPANWAEPENFFGMANLINHPISIFEYPEQIIVLGMLMGILAVVPTLISQAMSFRHSLPFVAAYLIMGRPVGFAAILLLSCLGAASRPLRFRSRIIAIALCISPQLFYWGYYGNIGTLEPVKAGFAYAPWLCALVTALVIAGMVLGIGHFTRYKPGLIFTSNTIFLCITIGIFQHNIGLGELDYQLYVAGNDPKKVAEFYDQNISSQLDATVEAIQKNKSPYDFYPNEEKLIRQRLKCDIQNELRGDRWLSGFDQQGKLNYQRKRAWLLDQYEKFLTPTKKWWMPNWLHDKLITSKARHKRLPIALYFKGMLSEFQPDIRLIDEKEILRFHSDYSHTSTSPVWWQLYRESNQSAESIEARWRIAIQLAGTGNFEKADELCDIALNMAKKQISLLQSKPTQADIEFRIFNDPPKTVITLPMLNDLEFRLNELATLINKNNYQDDPNSRASLAKLITLNPYQLDFQMNLDLLLAKTSEKNNLADNILLKRILRQCDIAEKAKYLKWLTEKFPNSDAALRASYELALIKVQVWKDFTEDNLALKNEALVQARDLIAEFIAKNPHHYLTGKIVKKLDALPTIK